MEKIKRKDNIIKRWFKLTNPHKGYFFAQILFYSMYTIFLTIITIFAARTINCMYNEDWTGAFINLGIELLTILLRNVGMHTQYYFYGKQIEYIRINVANKVYNKILSCNNSSLKKVTKEKVTNIALNNMANLSEFPDSIASFVAYSFQVVFTLVAVFLANWIAGIIVMLLGVVNFFAYYKFNKKMGKLLLERHEIKDQLYTSYCKVIDGKNVINELNGKRKYKKEVVSTVEKFSKSYAHYYNVYSWKNNIYWASWNIVIYAIAALMMYIVSRGEMDISVYLIIVPYLSTCTDKLCTLFDKTSNLENMRVDVDRVNLILELNDRELIKYGKINSESDGYNLGFVDVTYQDNPNNNYLKNADISFKMHDINVIKGESGCGKRVVFDLLRRYKKPQKGIILLDNLNLYDYNPKTFKTHIDYCASNPEFINGTIKENLSLVNKKVKNIEEVCKNVGLNRYLSRMQNGLDTQISDVKNSGARFLIGLARAILSDCNILMIYEIPQDQDEAFRKNIVNLLKKHEVNKTIILFTHSDDYDEIAGLTYEIKKGEIKLVKSSDN